MWFIGYDLDAMPPDHSVLSKARRRFGVLAVACHHPLRALCAWHRCPSRIV
jgi:hypothetical protein